VRRKPEPKDWLREAFVRDLIDLETFEHLRGLEVAGEQFAWPASVLRLMSSGWTDAPGQIFPYRASTPRRVK
jgi:hypothetical protein